jgi:hypothetical protein
MFRPRLPFKAVPAFSASNLCELCVSAFGSLSSLCSGGSSDPCSSLIPDSFDASIPFRITSFAGPHHVTPIESHLCKKQGRGVPTAARPKPFPFFPQRVNMQRAAILASPLFSIVYFTVVWIPRRGVFRRAPLPLLTTHYSLLTGLPITSTLPPPIYGIIPPHRGTPASRLTNGRNPVRKWGGFSD